MTTTSKENKILNAQGDKNITKKDLMKVFWRSFTMEWSWNYERQSNMSYTYAMIPIINKLYKTTIDKISLSDKIAEIKSIDTYIPIKDVPYYYIDAIIAVEDHRFRDHGAIDIVSIGRAIVSNIRAKELNEGGMYIMEKK